MIRVFYFTGLFLPAPGREWHDIDSASTGHANSPGFAQTIEIFEGRLVAVEETVQKELVGMKQLTESLHGTVASLKGMILDMQQQQLQLIQQLQGQGGGGGGGKGGR